MMAGGSRRHARIAGNIYRGSGNRLEAGPCSPYNSYMAIKTRPNSVRRPDMSVPCGKEDAEFDLDRAEELPVVVSEVLSANTSRADLTEKLPKYRALGSVDAVVLVDTVNTA